MNRLNGHWTEDVVSVIIALIGFPVTIYNKIAEHTVRGVYSDRDRQRKFKRGVDNR